jgi:putative membrane-bound dehydrogenase-like protein
MLLARTALLATLVAIVATAEPPSLPPGVTNSQKAGDEPPSPKESLAKITLPPGFHAQLFAAEPDVMQPIAIEFDDRGRLWVAECFAYPQWDKKNGVTNPTPDRILIFNDKNGDGIADERKVFLDKGRLITSVLPGFGGVWVLSVPELLFYPDANGDDIPDGPPVAHLDGWTPNARHNFVNGLAWGPDGWLYGRHGITTNSFVGKPGAPDSERLLLNCSIWRYHPVTQKFEVVCRGTTNPWGLDWDENGQAFFSNNVIGHFWHVIPGAFYKRMFGEHFNPNLYELMESCSDHLHWAGAKWQEARGGATHDALGGGHSHCGLMIYLGDNFPREWRGRAFMGNTHGNRTLFDTIERKGAGYTAKHGGNFLMANDPWFRSTAQYYGPDGGVFVTDWSDLGECHDHDGSHRTSGRIYKVNYGIKTTTATAAPLDLAKQSDADLIKLLGHANEWQRRHAQRLLQERAAAGKLAKATPAALLKALNSAKSRHDKLRALWACWVTGAIAKEEAGKFLASADEHERWWAIRLLTEDNAPSAWALATFARMAKNDSSAFVRLGLASALQRIQLADRWPIAEALLSRAEDAADKDLPLLIWYGIEPAVAENPARAAALLAKCQIPQVRQFITRRLAAK